MCETLNQEERIGFETLNQRTGFETLNQEEKIGFKTLNRSNCV